jgi:hypothetical protein
MEMLKICFVVTAIGSTTGFLTSIRHTARCSRQIVLLQSEISQFWCSSGHSSRERAERIIFGSGLAARCRFFEKQKYQVHFNQPGRDGLRSACRTSAPCITRSSKTCHSKVPMRASLFWAAFSAPYIPRSLLRSARLGGVATNGFNIISK